MAALKMLGDWLEGSGWVEALIQANIATQGVAESFLKASHVTRTRRAHQVTASSLHILMTKAYSLYSTSTLSLDQLLTFDKWCSMKRQQSPQFLFWETVLQMELLMLSFVRSLRKADFSLYVDSMTKLAH